jgi:hypothetical protein
MKMDRRLARNPLNGALGDALHAVMCGAGHNLRLFLAALRSMRPIRVDDTGAAPTYSDCPWCWMRCKPIPARRPRRFWPDASTPDISLIRVGSPTRRYVVIGI